MSVYVIKHFKIYVILRWISGPGSQIQVVGGTISFATAVPVIWINALLTFLSCTLFNLYYGKKLLVNTKMETLKKEQKINRKKVPPDPTAEMTSSKKSKKKGSEF